MRRPLVSVIVPVYNVAPYVQQCIDSILCQTYSNLDVILVNDGSTDDSGNIIEAVDDPRVRTFHQSNGGLSSARNTGLSYANGDYFCFVDSDDVIRQDYVGTLVDAALETNADLAIGGLARFDDSTPPRLEPTISHYTMVRQDDAVNALYSSKKLVKYTVAWTKLYHASLRPVVHFPLGKLHEDVAVALDVMLEARSIVEVDAELYLYRDNPRSIMNNPSWRHLDGLIFYEEHWKTLRSCSHPGADLALVAAFKTALGNLVDFSKDPNKLITSRFHRLVKHTRYLARKIPVATLSAKDRAVVLTMRIAPYSAIGIYRVSLSLRG